MLRIFSGLLLALALTMAASAQWKMNEFMIFAGGGGRQVTEARIKALADAGFNVIGGEKDKLDLCQKYGLKLMAFNVKPEDVPAMSKHPALWGYHIIDEPLHNFTALSELHQAFRKLDPGHPDYSNLISLGGEYLSSYMDTIKPRILSYDYYEYWWGMEGHFTKLELYRQAAMKAGIPWVLYFEVNSHPKSQWTEGGHESVYRPDNRERLRRGVFTALAYGLKGVEWWNGAAMFKPNTTELNECGNDVVAINADLKALGPILMKLHSVDVFQTEPLPRDTRAVPEDHWVQVFNYGYPGLVLGTFKDDDGVDYAMVSNTNYEGKQLVAMEIRRKFPVKTVERFDRQKRTWAPMRITDILSETGRNRIAQAYDFYMYSQRTGGDNITYQDINERWMEAHPGNQLVEFELAPGDGELFRIVRDGEFKTLRQEGKKYKQ
jgi:hypothetical protein